MKKIDKLMVYVGLMIMLLGYANEVRHAIVVHNWDALSAWLIVAVFGFFAYKSTQKEKLSVNEWYEVVKRLEEIANLTRFCQWPPAAIEIGCLIEKLENGKASDAEARIFRKMAFLTLQDWKPEYPPQFRERIQSVLSACLPSGVVGE